MIRSTLHYVDLCSLWLARLAAVFMAIIACLMLSEIFTRFVFNRSLGVTWELATYAMAAVISLAAADTLREAGHVRVALLLETLPRRFARLIDILATILGILIIGFLLTAFADFVWNMFQRGTRSFEPSRVLLWIPQSLALAGIAMLFVQLLARLVRLTVLGEVDLRSGREEVSQ